MRKIKFNFILAVFLITSLINIAHADGITSNIKSAADKNLPNQLILLKNLVNINSDSANPTGVKQVGETLKPYFNQLGFKTYWSSDLPTKNRAGTLFAEHSAPGKPCILLIGHLDTVFPKHGRFQFYQQKNNIAYGPGVADDKGGDVVILSALQILRDLNLLDKINIKVVLTGDEEDSAKPTNISRKPLVDASKNCQYALDFEPSGSIHSATIARRGITEWQINTSGASAHSSAIFQKEIGSGAIFEMSRILNSIRARVSHEKYLTFNPSMMIGGTSLQLNSQQAQGNVSGKQNVVAQSAIAIGDMRYLNEKDKTHLERYISLIIKHHLPHTSGNIVFEDGIPPMPPSKGNLKLLEQFSRISIELGYGAVHAVDPLLKGAADISYVASIVPQNLSGLGPIGGDEHTVSESLEIHSLPIASARAALLIYRIGS